MTENTPTPDEVQTAEPAEEVMRRMVRDLALLDDEERALLGSAEHIEAVTAERDALAATLAEAPHGIECNVQGPYGHPILDCTCWKSKLPEDALAARDRQQRIEGLTMAAAHLKEHDLTRTGDAIHALHRLADQLHKPASLGQEIQQ